MLDRENALGPANKPFAGPYWRVAPVTPRGREGRLGVRLTQSSGLDRVLPRALQENSARRLASDRLSLCHGAVGISEVAPTSPEMRAANPPTSTIDLARPDPET